MHKTQKAISDGVKTPGLDVFNSSPSLKRCGGYRKAFADFAVEKVARFSKRKIESLLLDPTVIRNRLKVEAVVNNAQAFLKVQNEFGSFDRYSWQFVEGKTIVNNWKSLK